MWPDGRPAREGGREGGREGDQEEEREKGGMHRVRR